LFSSQNNDCKINLNLICHGKTALILAIEKNNPQLIKMLLPDSDIEINKKEFKEESKKLSNLRSHYATLMALDTGRVFNVDDLENMEVNNEPKIDLLKKALAFIQEDDLGDFKNEETQQRIAEIRQELEKEIDVLKEQFKDEENNQSIVPLENLQFLQNYVESFKSFISFDIGSIEADLAHKTNVTLPRHSDASTALMVAIEHKNPEIIKTLIQCQYNDSVNDSNFAGKTALILAIEQGNLSLVEQLLTAKAHPNKRLDQNHDTPLICAIRQGHLDIAALLIQSPDIDLNLQSNGQTVLMLAIEKGEVDLVKTLLDRGADLNMPQSDGKTALILAIEKGEVDLVKTLLDRGADLNMPQSDGKTALILAIEKGEVDLVKTLLDRRAHSNKLKNQLAPFMLAIEKNQVEMVNALVKGSRKWLTENDGLLLLNKAIECDHLDVVNFLLSENRINLNLTDSEGKTPLILAIKQERDAIALALLESGKIIPESINYLSSSGETALLVAGSCSNQEKKIVLQSKLKECGADINLGLVPHGHITPLIKLIDEKDEKFESLVVEALKDPNIDVNVGTSRGGDTLLMMAIRNNLPEIITAILEKSLSQNTLNRLNQAGETALTLAIKSNNHALIKKLLDLGADPNRRQHQGCETNLMLAIGLGCTTTTLLTSPKIDLNLKQADDKTALMLAIERRNARLAKELLEHGADPNIISENEESALTLAITKKQHELVETLLVHGANPNIKMPKIKSPLILAIEHNVPLDVLSILIRYCNVDSINADQSGTALNLALQQGNNALVKELLNHGANPNIDFIIPKAIKNNWGNLETICACLSFCALDNLNGALQSQNETSLIVAIEQKNEDLVKILLDRGVSPNAGLQNDMTPLMMAIKTGQLAIVDMLLHHGVDIDAPNNKGQTALQLACSQTFMNQESIVVVEKLINGGADVNQVCIHGSALKMAITSGYDDIVTKLLDHPTLHIDEKNTAFTEIVKMYVENPLDKYIFMMNILMDKGADSSSLFFTHLSSPTNINFSLLAIFLNHPAFNINRVNSSNQTPLIALLLTATTLEEHAARQKCISVISALVERSPLLDQRYQQGKIALLLAIGGGFDEIVEKLLKQGANADNIGGFDETVEKAKQGPNADNNGSFLIDLIKSSTSPATQEIVLKLVEHSDVSTLNRVDVMGNSVLMHAINQKMIFVGEALLDKGVDISFHDKENMTALLKAIHDGDTMSAIASSIMKRDSFNGLSNSSNNNGKTALMMAIEKGYSHLVPTILKKEANPNLFDKSGGSALSYAIARPYADAQVEMLDLLLAKKDGVNAVDIDAVGQENGRTFLINTVNTGNSTTVQELLKHNPDVNKQDVDGNTALHKAVMALNPEIVEILLAPGDTRVNIENNEGKTPLAIIRDIIKAQKSARESSEVSTIIMKELLEAGAVENKDSIIGIGKKTFRSWDNPKLDPAKLRTYLKNLQSVNDGPRIEKILKRMKKTGGFTVDDKNLLPTIAGYGSPTDFNKYKKLMPNSLFKPDKQIPDDSDQFSALYHAIKNNNKSMIDYLSKIEKMELSTAEKASLENDQLLAPIDTNTILEVGSKIIFSKSHDPHDPHDPHHHHDSDNSDGSAGSDEKPPPGFH
jgi:ankyrin repeat protein